MNEGIIGAKEFSKIYPTKLFIDAAIGHILKEYSIDAILIGVDSYTQTEIINKIGTLPLAITANEFGVPLYVLGSSLKHYFGDQYNLPVPIEEKPPDEIIKQKFSNIDVKNYYFDRTPIRFISALITENEIYDSFPENFEFIKNFPIKIIEQLYTSLKS
jgi:methylthioribose-1-phosphate isomerase